MNHILIVDASESDRRTISGLLTRAGYSPVCAGNMEAAKNEAEKLPPGTVTVVGIKFPGGTAKEFIDWSKNLGKGLRAITIVDRMDAAEIYSVMQNHGAVDIIQRAAIDKQLIETVQRQTASMRDLPCSQEIVLIPRTEQTIKRLQTDIDRAAATDTNVIIIGESGTGKEQIARIICAKSRRSDKPVIMLEAGGAALVGKHDPESGNSKMYDRISGYFNNVEGGTLIIKNIQLLSFDKQSVFLHILANESHNVRILCTASPDILDKLKNGEFRESLFYRLRYSDVTVPSLRQTPDDILVVAEYLLEQYATTNRCQVKRLDVSAKKALKYHSWPGNIRELKHLLEISAFHANGDVITSNDLLFSQSEPEPVESFRLHDEAWQKRLIVQALEKTGGNISRASVLLGISRNTLSTKMKMLKLK